jgi:probable HAF family extracellular repeat protein/autotransporter-associated beta strand protein
MARLSAFVIFVASLTAGSAAGNTIQYTVTDLGPTSGRCSINAAGQVAFGSTLYGNGTFTSLGPNTTAYGINAAGQVAGSVYTSQGAYHAFLYTGGAITDLGTLGGAQSSASAVNATGQVVGESQTGAGATDAFLYTGGPMQDTGIPGAAYGINDSGEIVGASTTAASGNSQAFLYANGAMNALMPPLAPRGGIESCSAVAVNNNGQVLVDGWYSTFGPRYAFLYNSDGTWASLGSFAPSALNDAGEAVGATTGGGFGPTDAVIYESGTLTDLNALIDPSSGWTLEQATAINDNGQVAGWGLNSSGQQDAFLLTPTTPTPEPSTAALLTAAVVGLVGFGLRRWPLRRQRRGAKNTRCLRVESLEQRQLLDGGPGGAQFERIAGMLPDGTIAPADSSPATGSLSPQTVRQTYGIDSLISAGGDGTGQTIAIVDAYDDPDIIGDAAAFNSCYQLPQFNVSGGPTLTVLSEAIGTPLPGTDPYGPTWKTDLQTWEQEECLDVEWAHAVAPGANVILFEANSESASDLLTAVTRAAGTAGVSVVSMSWRMTPEPGEFKGEASYDPDFTTPTGHGNVTFLAAAGDSPGYVIYPAISPNVVSVGGTELDEISPGVYREDAWWGDSGGPSDPLTGNEAEPSYQVVAGVPDPTGMRETPDVSFLATGVCICDSYDFPGSPWIPMSGTSLATPCWAGLIAIADQYRSAEGLPLFTSNTALAALYGLYSTTTTPYSSGCFNDITQDSIYGGNSPYSAGTGYDLVTGIGSPIANNLIPAIAPAASNTVYWWGANSGYWTGTDSDWLNGPPSHRDATVAAQVNADVTVTVTDAEAAGSLELSNDATVVIATGATLTVTDGITIGAGSAVVVEDGGTLVLKAGGSGEWDSDGIAALLNSGGVTFDSGSVLAIDTTDAAGSFTCSANITGSFKLEKLGDNTLILSATNDFTGGTVVEGGVLEAQTPAALPYYSTAGSVSVASGATLAVSVGGSGEWNPGATGSIATLLAATTFDGGSALGIDTSDAGGDVDCGAAIVDGLGATGLTKLGQGTLILDNADNSYSGPTAIMAGSLEMGSNNASALGNSQSLSISSGAFLDLDGNSLSIGSLAGDGTVTDSASFASVTLWLSPSDVPAVFGGAIVDGVTSGETSLAVTGPAALVLTGENTYTGGTMIYGGTLQIGDGGTSGSITGDISVGSSGTLAFDRSDPASRPFSYSGLIWGGGNLIVEGGGTVNLSGGGAFGATTVTSGSTLEIDTPGGSGVSIGGPVSGGGDLVVEGGGKVTVLGADTRSSGTTILSGTLEAWTPASLPVDGNGGYSGVSIAPGATLAVAVGGPGDWAAGDIGTLLGTAAFSAGSMLGIDTTDGPFTYPNAITDPGGNALGLTVFGGNTLTLTASDTYTGGTTVDQGSTLEAATPGSLPGESSGYFGLSVLPGATLAVAVGGAGGWEPGDIVTLLGSGAFSANSTLGIDATDGPFTYPNAIADPGAGALGLTVLGGNTLTLTAANTYSDGTTIGQGSTLQVGDGGTTGSITGDVVDNGSLVFDRSDTLSYSGAISGSGNVVVTGGGTVALSGSNSATGGMVIASGTVLFGQPSAVPTGGIINISRPGGVDLTGLLGEIASDDESGNGSGQDSGQDGSGLSMRQTGGGAGQDTPAPGPTDLLYDIQASYVADSSGKDIDYDADGNYTGAYTISPDGKTVTFSSADAIPADGATVVMGIYADVLDANNDLAAWDATYGGQTVTVRVGRTLETITCPDQYDPSTVEYDRSVIPTYWPYLDVGVNAAALQFYNSAEGTDALPGDLSAAPDTGAFPFLTNDGTAFANANGGTDIGAGGIGPAEDSFLVIHSPPSIAPPSSSSFGYLTGTTDVSIDGSLYNQVCLGTLSFAVSSAAAGQSATINAAAVPQCLGGVTTFWMCDGVAYSSATAGGALLAGTIGSTDPVSISIADQQEDGMARRSGLAGVSASAAVAASAATTATTASAFPASSALPAVVCALPSPTASPATAPVPGSADSSVSLAAAAATPVPTASPAAAGDGLAASLAATGPLVNTAAVDAVLATFSADAPATEPLEAVNVLPCGGAPLC